MREREETVFGEHLSEACELSKSLRVMEKMHSTEKVTESAMLDKSLSSLEKTKTSVAEAAVCLPSQAEKSLAIKCSDKILVCLLEAQNGSANSTATDFEFSFYLVLPELKSKFIHSFHLFFMKMGRKKQGQGIPFSASLRDSVFSPWQIPLLPKAFFGFYMRSISHNSAKCQRSKVGEKE